MRFVVIVCVVALGLAAASQTKKPERSSSPAYVPPIFHLPVTWSGEEIKSDLDCDGLEDTFTWGKQQVTRYHLLEGKQTPEKADEVVLRVALARKQKGKTRSSVNHIPFRKTTGYYGFCTGPKEIKREALACEWEGGQLPGCDPARKCEALRLKDECSEFLVFWDPQGKQLTWVRPSPKLR